MNSNTIAQFYFTCDVNTGLANPFQSHIDDLNTAFTDIQTQLATAQASIPGEPDAAAVRQLWSTVREKVRDRSRPLYAMLDAAIVRAVEGDTLVLAHPAAPLAKRLTEQHNADVIRDALKDALGVNWRLRCEVGVGEPMPATDQLPPEPQPDPVQVQRTEEDELIAEVSRDEGAAPRRDPEEAALELLQTELGARRIDG